ncbi:MAG: class I SAM-dependent methyltransferase [Desulfuromonadaceae bacterium]
MPKYNLDSKELAEKYDELSESQLENGKKLIERLGIANGQSVLDIGAGTGRLAFHVLELIGPRGRLIGIDPLPERISIAVKNNRFPNAHFQVASAEDLSFIPSDSIDSVYLNAVFHWVPDKKKALEEIQRVLKPGGKVALTTGARELAHTACFRVVTDHVLSRKPYSSVVKLDEYVTARLGVTSTQLVELLLEAGLNVANIEIVSRRRRFSTGAQIVDFLESSTFGNYLSHVPLELRDQAREDIVAEFENRRTEDGIDFRTYTIFAIAEKKSSTP